MLVTFYGPSAVGKSSIMSLLNREYNWQFVRVLTTRANREDENEKLHVSPEDFALQIRSKALIFPNVFFGNQYALVSIDFFKALSSLDEVWMLDFSITERIRLLKYGVIEVFLLPEDKPQLLSQAKASDRSERIPLIEYEYHNFYLQLNKLEPAIQKGAVIVSQRDKIPETGRMIHSFVLENIRVRSLAMANYDSQSSR